MKSVACLAFVVFLSGCTAASNGANPVIFNSNTEQQAQVLSTLDLDLPTFVFRTPGNSVATPLDDERSEQMRIGFLEHHLKLNKACPKGYEITKRQVIITRRGDEPPPAYGAVISGSIYFGANDYFFEVIYAGRCTDKSPT